MTRQQLVRILEAVRSGGLSVEDALEKVAQVGYEDLGFAKVDLHRRQRRGTAEVVLCERKAPEHIVEIVRALDRAGQNIFCTRISPEAARYVMRRVKGLRHNKTARTLYKENHPIPRKKGLVVVVAAGTSDYPVAEEAAVTAEVLGSPVAQLHDVGVAGIHRLLSKSELLRSANVIVAVAGMEGALPSVVAGLVEAPVIAVPTSVGYGASFGGLAALLAMLNSCSSGIAVVNIDNGFGAGYFAHVINR
ncbi:MAG: nickel pincer cofactor biosynthesis protein LarB [Candidatus Sumerlaeia bacterium]|nr:nickel pincer cofactor biosynthesis protein LarB [Candidatus Sumerlaeia bacterium]